MDNDGELRLTIMATLAQEESRKKNNGHTIQRDCVTVIYIRGFAYAVCVNFLLALFADGSLRSGY